MQKITASFACLLCFLFSSLPAQTNVSGNYATNQHWTLSGSPYTVTSHVTILPAATLTIDPGVSVNFAGFFQIFIKGAIQAVGQPGNEIRFDGQGAENALHFNEADLSLSYMAHVDFEGGPTAIRVTGAASPPNPYTTFRNISIRNTKLYHSPYWGGITFRHSVFDHVEIQGNIQNNGGASLHIDSSKVQNAILNTTSYQNGSAIHIAHSQCDSLTFTTSFFTQGLYSRNILLAEDTLRHCNFRSDRGGVELFSCALVDCNFSDSLIQPYNASVYFISESILMNCDFIGGKSIAPSYEMSFFGAGNLIQSDHDSEFSPDYCSFNRSSLIGAGSGTGLRTLEIYSNRSTFQNHHVGLQISNRSPVNSSESNRCNFRGNSTYNVLCDATYGHIAQNSWWGSADSLQIEQSIHDAIDNPAVGLVEFVPFALFPDTAAPISAPMGLVDLGGPPAWHILNWQPNPETDLDGYRLHYGGFTGFSFSNHIDLGAVTGHTLHDSIFQQGFAITAYDQNADGIKDQVQGHESGFAFLGNWPTAMKPPLAQAAPTLSIFPNPATGQITLQFDRPASQREAALLDLTGRVLRTLPCKRVETQMDLGGLPAGVYLVRVQEGAWHTAKRITIQ